MMWSGSVICRLLPPSDARRPTRPIAGLDGEQRQPTTSMNRGSGCLWRVNPAPRSGVLRRVAS
jgi:hypothetical protein